MDTNPRDDNKNTVPDSNDAKISQITEELSKISISDTENFKKLAREALVVLTSIVKAHAKDQKFTVYVDDNFHFMDKDERYTLGVFDTEEEAVEAAKKIVDDFLIRSYKPGVTADDLYHSYMTWGEDPSIDASPFWAWDYAKARCEELCSMNNTE